MHRKLPDPDGQSVETCTITRHITLHFLFLGKGNRFVIYTQQMTGDQYPNGDCIRFCLYQALFHIGVLCR